MQDKWVRGSDKNFLCALGNLTGKPIKLLPNPARTFGEYIGSSGVFMGQSAAELSLFSIQCYNRDQVLVPS